MGFCPPPPPLPPRLPVPYKAPRDLSFETWVQTETDLLYYEWVEYHEKKQREKPVLPSPPPNRPFFSNMKVETYNGGMQLGF